MMYTTLHTHTKRIHCIQQKRNRKSLNFNFLYSFSNEKKSHFHTIQQQCGWANRGVLNSQPTKKKKSSLKNCFTTQSAGKLHLPFFYSCVFKIHYMHLFKYTHKFLFLSCLNPLLSSLSSFVFLFVYGLYYKRDDDIKSLQKMKREDFLFSIFGDPASQRSIRYLLNRISCIL